MNICKFLNHVRVEEIYRFNCRAPGCDINFLDEYKMIEHLKNCHGVEDDKQ